MLPDLAATLDDLDICDAVTIRRNIAAVGEGFVVPVVVVVALHAGAVFPDVDWMEHEGMAGHD